MKPRARSGGLVLRTLGDETLVYDLERHKALCLGPIVARIWHECDGKTTVVEIAHRLREELGASVDEEVVSVALRRLARHRLLLKSADTPIRGTLGSRRALLRKAALLGGLSVAAITVPKPADAASPISDAACAARHPPCGNAPCSQNPGNQCKQVSATMCSCTQN